MMVYRPTSTNSTNRDPVGIDMAVRQGDDRKMTAKLNLFKKKTLPVSRKFHILISIWS